MRTVSVRDLRTRFPRIKTIVDREGEVVVTDHGRPVYVLRPYVARAQARQIRLDHWARLKRRQPQALTADQRRALDDENRGER